MVAREHSFVLKYLHLPIHSHSFHPLVCKSYTSETKMSSPVATMSHYETLEISRTATSAEVAKAYKKLALKYHPDKNKDEDATEKFQALTETNTTLSDPDKRKTYDVSLNVTAEAYVPESFGGSPRAAAAMPGSVGQPSSAYTTLRRQPSSFVAEQHPPAPLNM